MHILKSTRARRNRLIGVKKRLPRGKRIHLEEEDGDRWSIYVDGSSAQKDGGVGILLVGPGKEKFKYSIRFRFSVTNNIFEYEALLLGLKLAKKI